MIFTVARCWVLLFFFGLCHVCVGGDVPAVGASIAVHPPKFALLARFLYAYSRCLPAQHALSLFVVFSSDEDLQAFQEKLGQKYPEVKADLWTRLVVTIPKRLVASGDQVISAWKKWYGVAYMMDQGVDGPRFGAMLDAELMLYDAGACGKGSPWNGLLQRLLDAEAGKTFPAARVDDSRPYNFGTFTMTAAATISRS